MSETIVAIATPPGRGGVGVIRISGSDLSAIVKQVIGQFPTPRKAFYTPFRNEAGEILDLGIALYFQAPHSFTGEEVLELQGHGGPLVMDSLLQAIIQAGARLAKPGEFSQRAFVNDKLDLTQAEAIADLIDASSTQAARLAIRSLQGEFSQKINSLVKDTINLRLYVEAAIDFPDEEIDLLAEPRITQSLRELIIQLETILKSATQGAMLRDGFTAVIAGEPNVGKSTLLNALSGREVSIVTDIPGTTRDVMRERILIDGLPLQIIDTAGIRASEDSVEREGIARAWREINQADMIIALSDAGNPHGFNKKLLAELPSTIPIIYVQNKIDLQALAPRTLETEGQWQVDLSAATGEGLDLLRQLIKKLVGLHDVGESLVLARRRHLTALTLALECLCLGERQLYEHRAGELLAEDLRIAQGHLSEITGEFTADDLLGEIFGRFCIGK
jgi:tRNA modification GTPase